MRPAEAGRGRCVELVRKWRHLVFSWGECSKPPELLHNNHISGAIMARKGSRMRFGAFCVVGKVLVWVTVAGRDVRCQPLTPDPHGLGQQPMHRA